jgi:DNA helicase-2/ATP-dependent DNA helicase PcrA
MEQPVISPAEKASEECIQKVFAALREHRSFRLEAGAGAGKTYTLIKSLKFLINEYGETYLKTGKQIACITYTNVAKDEIQSRTDNHPVVCAETIHAFCWNVIQDFQKFLRSLVPGLSEKWAERCTETGELGNRRVVYNLGYPKVTDTEIFLHHDDVIKLMAELLADQKFQLIVKARFPIILIDEYQDTNKTLAEQLVRYFIEPGSGPLIGFFGDHWQTIFGTKSVGLIYASPERLEAIGKNANFRSAKNIVMALNRIRPELPQQEKDPKSTGSITIFHTNGFLGTRRTGNHWKGDLPAAGAHEYLEVCKEKLGWAFEPGKTKILMLTNNVLAAEQGYHGLLSVFTENDDLLKKNNDYIAFLADIVEPGAAAFEAGKFGQMMQAFDLKSPRIKTLADKKSWYEDMTQLCRLRKEGTIGEVLDHLKKSRRPRLPSRLEEKERRYLSLQGTPEADRDEEAQSFFKKAEAIRAVPYLELTNVANYIDDKTLFSTNHGVKGAEFENVLVVLGRGWNHYNWNQLLEWVKNGVPAGSEETFERNRNLFYVACSRPIENLALLFTQELSQDAIDVLEYWFGVQSGSL